MRERYFELGKASYGDRASVMDRQLSVRKMSRSALTSPPPGSGEIIRTALPDTFDGIRFEIGKMLNYVKHAANDPFMNEHARSIVNEYASSLAQGAKMNGASLAGVDSRSVAVEAIERWCREHYVYVNDPPNIEIIQTPKRMVKQTMIPAEVIRDVIAPVFEAMEEALGPQVRDYEVPGLTAGDCVTLTTRVILRDRQLDRYVVKELGEIKDDYSRYEALSYNFESQKYEFKPIVAWINKGVLPVWRMNLWMGRSLECTLHHKIMFLRKTTGGRVRLDVGDLHAVMERMPLACKPKIPVALKIPDLASIERPEELLWIEGLYAAEGWTEGSHTALANKDLAVISRVEKTLVGASIPYSKADRWDGVYTIRFKTSDFKNHLRTKFGSNSFSKRFPGEYLSLPHQQMSALIDGYAQGDAYKPKPGSQWAHFARLVHNTSSGEMARQLMFMHSVLGRPLSPYLQKRHGGSGKSPIWRLMEYRSDKTQSKFTEVLPGVMKVGIRSIDLIGDREVCDISVMDNFNFVTEEGVITKNCDEGSTLMNAECAAWRGDSDEMSAALGALAGPMRPIRFRFGGNGGTLHHVWARPYLGEQGVDCDLTEPEYGLGDYSKFEQYEELEVAL